MEPHIQELLESIHNSLSAAGNHTTVSPEQIGDLISAVKQLADLTERLYDRIVELEHVQNERASD